EYYAETTPAYATTTEYVPYDAPAPVSVSIAPPPPRYEPVITCGYGSSDGPGRWGWSSRWYWARGYCATVQCRCSSCPPRSVGGVSYGGYWGRPTTIVTPAPVHGGGAPYVAPPAPVYGGGTTYVAPPRPVYGGGTTYVAPPRPVYGGGTTYVAPTVARPAP